MMRAKTTAFMERQDTVYRRYPLSDTSLARALRGMPSPPIGTAT